MNIRLKNLREEKKISQAYLAKELNISQPQYQRKEVGYSSFTDDEFDILSEILEVPISQIKEDAKFTQNNFNQKGGIAQVIYYIADKLVDEVKDLSDILKEELKEYKAENRRLKEVIEELKSR